MVGMRLNPSRPVWLRTVLPHARELGIIAGAYFIYMYTRSLVFDDFGATALANAGKIISLEKSLGFFWEPDWQARAIDGARALVVFFNWTYIVTFWPIILTAGTILYVRNLPRYRYYRNIVLLSFALALIGFILFPLAPPRMIVEHFVDTIKAFGPTFYASREFANFYNPYAAMPSLHFSWTVMFGVLFLRTPNKWVKILGIIYPTTTLLAITITANHYIMDAIAGAALMIAAFALMELVFRRRLFLPQIIRWVRVLPYRRGVANIHKSNSSPLRAKRALSLSGGGTQGTPAEPTEVAEQHSNPAR